MRILDALFDKCKFCSKQATAPIGFESGFTGPFRVIQEENGWSWTFGCKEDCGGKADDGVARGL